MMSQRLAVRFFAVATLLACLGIPARGDEPVVSLGGTGSALGLMHHLIQGYSRDHPGVRFAILPSLGSSGCIRAATEGAIDIGVSGRTLKEGERVGGIKALPFAFTPFILLSGSRDSPRALSTAQMIDAFAGRLTAWPDDGRTLRVIVRPENDADISDLVTFMPKAREAVAMARQRVGVPMAYTDQENMDLAEAIPDVLTTGTLAAIRSEGRNLRPVILDGVEPTLEAMNEDRYPMKRTFWLILPTRPREEVLKFVTFLRSDAATAILRTNGALAIGSDHER